MHLMQMSHERSCFRRKHFIRAPGYMPIDISILYITLYTIAKAARCRQRQAPLSVLQQLSKLLSRRR